MSGCGAEKGLISIDEALTLMRSTPQTLMTETLPLAECLNRYLAQDVVSPVDLPSFSQSAVDGYALHTTAEQLQDEVFHVIGPKMPS